MGVEIGIRQEDISGAEHLVLRIRHALQVAIGAGGAEHLVLRIRPARPVSSWWGTSTSITPCRWPSTSWT
ncbi:hypothetical protein [Pseudomonas aeruginosa]|uniref:hypothetical protein n=1 Tax=Pseudomonas aeruginosa TaxID=287 RepID=UPI0031B75219